MRRVVPGVLIVISFGSVFFGLGQEISRPTGVGDDVKLYRNLVSGGTTTVVDAKSGRPLFFYLPEYDRHVHPIKIEKIDERHWQVLFEDPE